MGQALPASRWLLWIVMLMVAVLLIAAGLQGTLGSTLAAILTPAALDTTWGDTHKTAATTSAAPAPPTLVAQ